MSRTIEWSDGTRWTADEADFRRVTERLGAVRGSIWGLDAIFARWEARAAAGDAVAVDEVAPTEDDRAVLTAALARASEEAHALTPSALGFDDVAAYRAFLARLDALHELFVTDVTHALPDAKKKR